MSPGGRDRQCRRTGRPTSLPLPFLFSLVLLLQASWVQAWVERINSRQVAFPRNLEISRRSIGKLELTASITSDEETAEKNNDAEFKPSFYQTQLLDPRGRPIWKERKQLSEIKVGDELKGHVVQEHLDGATGPKLFLECGVGRYNQGKKTWRMANAMLRLGRRGTKESVTRKRVARLKKQTAIECYVSRIRIDNGHLEVVLKPGDLPDPDLPPKLSVTSLKAGQQVVGTVQRLVPYGAFVDVGANRVGLLHIQKVADLYGDYIDKEKGLIKAGLERGTKIKVQVESNDKKRLFLDFTTEVKEQAEKERLEQEEQMKRQEEAQSEAEIAVAITSGAVATASSAAASTSASTDDESEDPYAAYAAEYASTSGVDDEDEDPYAAYAADDHNDGGYDDYDEERDIEDSLGLGSY